MKTKLRMLALLASLTLALVGLGAGSSTASAANCTNVYATSTYTQFDYGVFNHQIYYLAYVKSCTSVSAIRWYSLASGTYTGWYDATGGSYAMGLVNGCGYGSDCDYTLNSPGSAGGYATIAQLCWWYGATRTIQPLFWYAIKNAASPYNWGPQHLVWGATQGFYC